jgi:hypothetical protein
MFAFFLSPGYFIHSPIVNDERRYLRTSFTSRRGLTRAIFALLIFVCGVSVFQVFWQFTGAGAWPFLLNVIAIAYAFHLVVVVFAINRTARSVARELDPQRWENLILTGISAGRIVIGKWWSVTISTVPLFLIAALFKFCVAYGLAKHLHTSNHAYFDFYGTALLYSNDYYFLDLAPSLVKCLFGLFILSLYGVAEAGLVTAMTIACILLWKSAGVVLALVLRGLISVSMVLGWIGIVRYTETLEQLEMNLLYTNPVSGIFTNVGTIRDWQHLFEFTQITFSPLADSGTLLVTDLMRPISAHFHSLQTFVSAALGLLLFLLFIGISLYVGQKLAIRRGASPMVILFS